MFLYRLEKLDRADWDSRLREVNDAVLFIASRFGLLAMHASCYRSSINTLAFLKKVLRTCTGKPVVLVDGGPWYPWALDRYALKWLHVSLGERNVVEKFFRARKERARRFYDNLLSNRLEKLESFLNLFMTWCNHLRKH